jgi:hypothetical protein
MSEALHQLIKSLSKNEKAYIKKFAHKKESSKSELYYKLFGIIDRQDDYNEKKALKKVQSFLNNKQFSSAKNYLNSLILDSLCDYHEKKSLQTQIQKSLQQIEIFCRKRLYKQAQKVVKKVKKTAQKYEFFPLLMQIHFWEEEISRSSDNPKEISQYITKGFDEEFKVIEQWKNFRLYRKMCNNFYGKSLSYSLTRTNESDIEMKQEMNSTLYKEESKALSFLAKTTRNYTLTYGSDLIDDEQSGYIATKNNIELMQQNPDFCIAYPLRYIVTLFNISIYEIFRNNEQGTQNYIKDFEKIKPQYYEEKLLRDTYLIIISLLHYSQIKDKSNNIKIIDELSSKFNGIKDKINLNDYCEILHLLLVNYFIIKDYHTTVKMIEEFEKKATKDISTELLIGSKIFGIIANYELDNDFFVDYLGDATYRLIHKQTQIYKTEKALISFLKRIVNLPERSSEKAHFEKFKKDLEKLEKGGKCGAFGIFDLMKWVEEKISTVT